MTLKALFAASATAALLLATSASAAELTVGFSQIGSESGWRAAETSVSKSEAAKRKINLKIADAQQKQENQIKAIRSFIAQNVDAIFLAPVVASGWDAVLKEAKEAKIPVVLLDRDIDPKDRIPFVVALRPRQSLRRLHLHVRHQRRPNLDLQSAQTRHESSMVKLGHRRCRRHGIPIDPSGPLAQLVRAGGSYPLGCRFESCRAYHSAPTPFRATRLPSARAHG